MDKYQSAQNGSPGQETTQENHLAADTNFPLKEKKRGMKQTQKRGIKSGNEKCLFLFLLQLFHLRA